MSHGLGHGRVLDPGLVGVSPDEYPPLPDAIMADPLAGRMDPRAWFREPERPLEIEIGSGKGSFLLNAANGSPSTNYLGVEWEGEFWAYTCDRVRRAGLANVRVLHADGVEFLRWRCPDALARVIHLYYSDPWPKKKHHKNRVVRDEFLREAWRVLAPGGELRIVTDHDEYWAWMEEHFARWTAPERAQRFDRLPFEAPEWVGEGQVIATNYEKKMCGDRKHPHAAVLRKQT